MTCHCREAVSRGIALWQFSNGHDFVISRLHPARPAENVLEGESLGLPEPYCLLWHSRQFGLKRARRSIWRMSAALLTDTTLHDASGLNLDAVPRLFSNLFRSSDLHVKQERGPVPDRVQTDAMLMDTGGQLSGTRAPGRGTTFGIALPARYM